ncbi:MAC/perforin domain-containing protein [Burkholderia sp. AW33-5]
MAKKTQDAATTARLEDDDPRSLQLLLSHIGAGSSYKKLQAQGVTNLVELRKVIGSAPGKDALRKALSGKTATTSDALAGELVGADDVDERLGTLLTEIEPNRMVKLKPPARTILRPRANAELKAYLGANGFGAELMPVFESEGVTSLDSLRRALNNKSDAKGTFQKLTRKLGKTTDLDATTTVLGSAELSNQLASLSLPMLEAEQAKPRPDFRQSGLDANAVARYEHLKQAVDEVNALRQQDADKAHDLSDDISEKTQQRLASILTKVNSRDLLNVFDGRSPATVEDLNEALDAVTHGLSRAADEAFSALIFKDWKPQDVDALATQNCLKRGLLISATGIYEVSGSDLVTAVCGRGTPAAYEEVVSDYESEQNYQLAERTIKESSHTYSTSNSLLGGFFTSSGIGAICGAFQYAKSRMTSESKAHAQKTWQSVKVKERSVYAPKMVITLPRETIALSDTAVRHLMQISKADPQLHDEYARLFLSNFGGHVFRSVTLGGRYSYVARAESTSRETYDDLETALSEAQQKAGSLGAGFFGKFLAGGSSAHENTTSSVSATSMVTKAGKKQQDVRVNIVGRGGLQEMPFDQWRQSLLRSEWWSVIDRREAIAVWDLLRTTESVELDADKRGILAKLLERVWIHDVFLQSLNGSDLACYRRLAEGIRAATEKGTRIDTVKQLEEVLKTHASALAKPQMRLKYVTVTRDEETKGGAVEVTLPPPWKILSGGGGALTNTDHVLIESYPIKETKNGKEIWKWRLKTRAAAYTDHDDRAKAKLTMGLILLYDPDNEWDVRVFDRKAEDSLEQHEMGIDAFGFVITGGGARIDYYERPTITGIGFPHEAVTQARYAPLRVWCVKTANVQSPHGGDGTNVRAHMLTGYVIAIKATNGAALEPVYTSTLTDKRHHPTAELVHERGASDSPMIGGGAWVTGQRNFISWSMPVLDADGRGIWKAYSADRADWKDEQQLQLVTIGLKNIETSITPESHTGAGYNCSFKDAYTDWKNEHL